MKFIKRVLKYFRKRLMYFKLKRKLKDKNKVIIFGTPFHGNLGDHAIIEAEKKIINDYLNKNIVEISSYLLEDSKIFDNIKKYINNSDLLFITGGGSMGDIWLNEELIIRKIITCYPNNKIIIFPQTVFYTNTLEGQEQFIKSIDIYNNHPSLTLCVREEKSYNFVKKNYNVKCLLVPDIVLYLDNSLESNNRNNILFLMRKDKEKILKNDDIKFIEHIINSDIIYSDTVLNKRISIKKRKKYLKKKIDLCKNSKMIITDRLHGMIFAYITNTPCIAFNNYNFKVEGVYKWISDCNYIKLVKNIDEFEKKYLELINLKEIKKINIKDKYQELIEVMR